MAAEIQRIEPTNKFVRVPGIGGFSIDNLSYWKMNSMQNGDGVTVPVVTAYFRTGGFIDMPDLTEAQFTSAVYGEPY